MSSLDYLSKKSILMEEIRKNQLNLLELKKDHQILIKNEEIQSKNGILTFNEDEVRTRNQRLIQDLRDQYDKVNRVRTVDHGRLRSLKEQYVRSLKEAEDKEVSQIIKEAYDGNVDSYHSSEQNTNVKIGEILISPRITPHFRDNIEQLRFPRPTDKISPRKEEKINSYNHESNVYDTQDGRDESVVVLDEVNKEDAREDIQPPLITPRLSDHRERMVSPRILANIDLKIEEVFVNDDNRESDFKKENLKLETFIRIFEVIEKRLDEYPGDYKEEYLGGAKAIDQVNKERAQSIRRLLGDNKTFNKGEASLKNLVLFMVDYLPRICVDINFDVSELLHMDLKTLMNVKSSKNRLTFENLNDMIMNKLCRSHGQTTLWNLLVHHFHKLILDGLLSSTEVSEIFSPLLMPISSTDSNEEEIIEIISSWLSYASEKQKSLFTISSTAEQSTLLSDDDTYTYSSTSSDHTKQPQKNKVERTYSDLRRSLNVINGASAKMESMDDDPNADINDIFAKPKNKGGSATKVQMSLSKERLTKSIINIDDDISDYELFQSEKEAKKNCDDEFDFR